MASGETNFASLPSKTSPSNADMFLLEDTEDTKKINYSALADAILNKLTSKTYSGLDTSAKNLVSAINELNSKTYYAAYENGENIPENSDLNDYFDIGVYHITNNTAAATIKNYPPGVSTGGRLEVCECGPGWIHQILYPNNGADIYIRCSATDAWYKITAQQL